MALKTTQRGNAWSGRPIHQPLLLPTLKLTWSHHVKKALPLLDAVRPCNDAETGILAVLHSCTTVTICSHFSNAEVPHAANHHHHSRGMALPLFDLNEHRLCGSWVHNDTRWILWEYEGLAHRPLGVIQYELCELAEWAQQEASYRSA